MKYILFCLLTIFLFQCKEKELPIIDDEPKFTLVNKPCYDSTYFDTTIAMKKVQFPYFSINIPEGASYDYGWLDGHTWGGYIKYGCDSLIFSYGKYVSDKLEPGQFYRVDTVIVDDNEALISYAYNSEYEFSFLGFLIVKSEEERFGLKIHNYRHEPYALKMFHSFKFGW